MKSNQILRINVSFFSYILLEVKVQIKKLKKFQYWFYWEKHFYKIYKTYKNEFCIEFP